MGEGTIQIQFGPSNLSRYIFGGKRKLQGFRSNLEVFAVGPDTKELAFLLPRHPGR